MFLLYDSSSMTEVVASRSLPGQLFECPPHLERLLGAMVATSPFTPHVLWQATQEQGSPISVADLVDRILPADALPSEGPPTSHQAFNGVVTGCENLVRARLMTST